MDKFLFVIEYFLLMSPKKNDNKKSIMLKEDIQQNVALKHAGTLSLLEIDDPSNLVCYHRVCHKPPSYLIGALLPGIWIKNIGDNKLVPFIYVSCIEHRLILIDALPRKTLTVIVQDISRDSYKLIKNILENTAEEIL